MTNNSEDIKVINIERIVEEYTEHDTSQIIREHIYNDKYGKPRFKVVRNNNETECKYSIYTCMNDIWVPKLNPNMEKIPYNLPQIIEAAKDKKTIIITGGEKDSDIITNLSNEFVATTGMTSSIYKWSYEFNKYLAPNMPVIILKDDTEFGEAFVEKTRESLKYKTHNITTVSIQKIKEIFGIEDTSVTDITEVRNEINDDEALINMLKKLIDWSEKNARGSK